MASIGRKIYYELNTGNTICSTSSASEGIASTIEQDFVNYIDLSGRVQSSVGVIQLEFGDFEDKFQKYNFHVNVATNSIVWGSLINPTAPPVQLTNQELGDNQLILMDVLATMYEDMLAKGTV